MAKMVNSVVGKMYDVLEEYIDNLNGTPEEKADTYVRLVSQRQ